LHKPALSDQPTGIREDDLGWIDCSPGVYDCELVTRFTGLQPVPRRSDLGVSFPEGGHGTAGSLVPAMVPTWSPRVELFSDFNWPYNAQVCSVLHVQVWNSQSTRRRQSTRSGSIVSWVERFRRTEISTYAGIWLDL